MPRHSKKKRSPFSKAVFLTIALIIALFLYHKVATTNLIERILSFFESSVNEFSSQSKFTDEERNSVIKLVSGFWVYKSDTNDVVSIDDRIEITDNGYIWQVEQIKFTLPSGGEKNITHVFHGFLYPSSQAAFDTTFINCVVRYLPQMWIYDGDTCVIKKYHGKSRKGRVAEDAFADLIADDYKDETVDVFIDDKIFKMKDREYISYTNKDIQNFFPVDLIDMVYNLTTVGAVQETKMYEIKNKEVILNKDIKSTNKIKLTTHKECINCRTVKDFLRMAIAKDLQHTSISKREHNEVIKLIKKYYMPMCLKIIKSSITIKKGVASQAMKISFDLTWRGETENISIRIPGDAIYRKWHENEMIREIKQWKFQPLEKESPPIKVSFLDTLTH